MELIEETPYRFRLPQRGEMRVPGIVDRGLRQAGSLGSGNHFLEVQAVEEIYDATTAQRFGLMTRRRGPVAGCSQRSVCP